MQSSEAFKLAEPRFADGAAMSIVGMSGSYTREQTGEIPAQWAAFNQALSATPPAGWDAQSTYGVVYPSVPMHYVTGVEVPEGTAPPEGWQTTFVPAQHYAIFAQTGGVAAIRAAFMAIFMEWMPMSGKKMAAGPMLEKYPENWVASGDFEVWIPVI